MPPRPRRNTSLEDSLLDDEVAIEQHEKEVEQNLELEDRVLAIKSLIGEDTPIKVRLHKANGNRFPQIDVLDESTVDPHEIGVKHGSGKYKVYISWTDATGKPQVKQLMFELDKNYDTLKKERDLLTAPIAITGTQSTEKIIEMMMLQNQQNMEQQRIQRQIDNDNAERIRKESSDKMNMLLTGFMTLASTIIPAMINRPAPQIQPQNDLGEKLLLTLMPTLLSQGKNATGEALALLREGMEMGKEIASKAEPEEKSWIDLVESVIEQSPMILQAIMPPKEMQKQIESNPEMKAIIDDDQKFKYMVEKFIAEKGKEFTVTLLEKTNQLDRAKNLNCI
jgi:hypothetical protein